MRYSAVMVIKNKALNETVASSFRESDNMVVIQDWINQARRDFTSTSCQATVTISERAESGQDYSRIDTIVINATEEAASHGVAPRGAT